MKNVRTPITIASPSISSIAIAAHTVSTIDLNNDVFARSWCGDVEKEIIKQLTKEKSKKGDIIIGNKRHKRRPPNGEPTATFENLDFAEQAKSITATTNVLGRMIDSNVRRAAQKNRDVDEIKRKRLDQVQRMINKKR